MLLPFYSNNLNEYYVTLARKNFARRKECLDKITTKEQAETYVREVRSKIEKIFTFPKRTPLNVTITGKNTYEDYSVENILYYSRPSYPVTANMYLPAERKGKVPAILFLCGHAIAGKGNDIYRTACITLVKKGFAVFVVDPVEQGERQQYLDSPTPFGLCGNHTLMGKHLSLCGEWFGVWRTWDAVRALDYMETREEIDSSRIGVTGNSGGGTLTTWLAASDPRPVAVVPSCYVTSWKHNVENELPADIEQKPPCTFAYGLEMGDFLLAQAPRHIMIQGQERDFFDPRGVVETFEEVKKINSLLSGKDTQYFIGPDDHGYFKANREAMYGFFTEHLMGKKDPSEPEITLSPEKETFAIEGGVLKNLPGNKYLRTITKELGEELKKARKEKTAEELKTILRDILKITPPEKAPYYRKLRWRMLKEGLYRNRYGLETEENVIMAVLADHSPQIAYNPCNVKKNVTLFIPSADSREELGLRSPAEEETLFALDMRGIGELTPSGVDLAWNAFFSFYQFDYHFAVQSYMWNAPLLGKRVFDILSAVALITENAPEDMVLTVEGHGRGCIPALMAALLSDKIHFLKLTEESIGSYEEILDDPFDELPLSFMAPGILKEMDLPDMKKAVAHKLVEA